MTTLDDQAREQERIARERERFMEVQRRASWKQNLRFTANKKAYLGDLANVFLAFEHWPLLKDLVRFNELTRRIELQRAPPWRTLTRGIEWCDDDDTDLADALQREEIPVHGALAVVGVVHSVSQRNSYHPVRDWLQTLKWDGEPRITEVLIEVLGATGNGDYLGAVLRRFLISAVARVMRPGCKADHMLVLVGPQGLQKSTFTQVLGGAWARESNAAFGSKDAIAELEGAWIMEAGELSSLSRTRIDVMNHFVSRRIDHYRPAYGRAVVDQPRSCVFVGTVNEPQFLRDYTGGRRFWPINCGQINLPLLQDSREQLWAEAFAAFTAGEQWHLTEAEEKLAAVVQEEHRAVSTVEEDVHAWLSLCLTGTPLKKLVTVSEVYESICDDHERRNLSARRQVETAIGQSIRRAGWTCIGRRGIGKRTTYRYDGELPGQPDN